MDRTTKALLLAIALGLWANVVGAWVKPVPVMAQEDLVSLVRVINSQVNNIANGYCLNLKICGTGTDNPPAR